MKTVYSEEHHLHAPAHETVAGQVVPYFEKSDRAQFVLDAMAARNLGEIVAPHTFPVTDITAIHPVDYVTFLQTAHNAWIKAGHEGDARGTIFNMQNPGLKKAPKSIDGQLGYYTGDDCAPLTATSWDAIQSSAQVALTAQQLVASGERSAFALCRPPGHHASAKLAAGYCYLNNAAIAAQKFLNDGAKRVAILDVDYHHGNGTQDIFYDRDDVFFASLHADPDTDYPYFLGYASETGKGRGEGFNVNYPLPQGTTYDTFSTALKDAVEKIKNYGPDALIISLGVDTFEDDPISKFKIRSNDYLDMGRTIATIGAPTLFVMEGGYAVEEIGINIANTLEGFLSL